MHETDPTPPTLADLEARWARAEAALRTHARLGTPNGAPLPDFRDEDELRDWLAARQAWRVEWARLQTEARVAVVALYRARQAEAD